MSCHVMSCRVCVYARLREGGRGISEEGAGAGEEEEEEEGKYCTEEKESQVIESVKSGGRG